MSPEVAEMEVWPLADSILEAESSSAAPLMPLSCLIGRRYFAGDPGKDLLIS